MSLSNSGEDYKDATEDSFCLDDYDCIGFDMDHTIVQYHIEELFKVHSVAPVCHLESCKITLKSFLAFALNSKFVPGKSIF